MKQLKNQRERVRTLEEVLDRAVEYSKGQPVRKEDMDAIRPLADEYYRLTGKPYQNKRELERWGEGDE